MSTIGIYIRVSKEEQAKEGYSISAQKQRLTSYCDAMGWKDYKLYIDPGVSAKDMNRPKLQLLLNDVKAGRISTILVYRLDRFTRKVKDLHKMLEMLEANNCAFKSATEPYDTSTAMGKLFITIVAALAEWEADNLSERIKMGLEEKVSGGEWVGNVPFGFDLSEEGYLIKNEHAPIVMDMIEKYEKGWGFYRIAKYLNLRASEVGRNWHANAVLRILTNPVLYGAVRYSGKIYENQHEGYITKERWLRLQKMVKERGKNIRRDVKSTYLFQGILRCETCGSNLAVGRFIRKKRDGTEYQTISYRCKKCIDNGIKSYQPGEGKIEDALIEYMKTVTFEDLELQEEKDEETEIFKKELLKIEKQREKYQRAWAADLISDEEFEERMNETKTLYEELQEKINQINKKNGQVVKIDPEQLKKIVFTFKEVFSNLTKEEKRDFIQMFIKEIHFKTIPQPPKDPRHKKGKPKVVVTDVIFY